MSKRDIDALREYDRQSGVTVAHQDAAANLRAMLADVERRMAFHVAARTAALARIADGNYEARQGLTNLGGEIRELSARADYLRRAVARVVAA